MSYKLLTTNRFDKSLKKLDKQSQRMIVSWIKKNIMNSDNPRYHGKALVGNLNNFWRYRIGSYRIVCDIQDEEITLILIDVGNRKDIYKKINRVL